MGRMQPRGWRSLSFGYCGLAGLALSSSLGAIVSFPAAVHAQVVADPSIGTIVTPNGTTFQITGGTIAGNRNLFHSFSRFDVPTGGVASFLNSPNIVNIFSRVTGGTPSQIDGIVRSAGTANLFLMNPSGIIFGQNAQLDVGGSFVATTANAIQFGDRGVFNASLSEPPNQLLTIDPSALLFNQPNIAPIQSNVRNLGVQEGKSLLLIGGDVTLNNSFLYVKYVEGGRVELGGLAAPGKIDLTIDGSIFRLDFPINVLLADVSLTNNSSIDVTTGGGGSIAINARNLILRNSRLLAGISGGYGSVNSVAGDININATDSVILTEQSRISNHVFENNTGISGNIDIQTQRLVVRNSQIGSSVFGSGKAGNLVVHASDSVDLSGEENGPGGLLIQIENTGTGQGGNLFLETGRLSISDGSKVQVSSFGNGNAGNLFIRAKDINVFETSVSNVYSTSIDADNAQGRDATNSPNGNGGNLTIETERLRVSGGASISASVYGTGNAGNLRVYATDFIELSGDSGKNGGPGGLLAQVNPGATGHGGNLTVETRRLSVSDGSKVQVSTFGDGDAGNLLIQASGIDVFNTPGVDRSFSTSINADVGRDSRFSGIPQGNGGDLTIATERLSIRAGGEVSASTYGTGNAGNLRVYATDFIELSGDGGKNGGPGGLLAQVNPGATGHGGNLTVETRRLSVSDGSKVQVSTFGDGDAGNLLIQASEIDVFNTPGVDRSFSTSINADVGRDSRFSGIPQGNGGDLTIATGRLSIRSGGEVTVDTFGKGNAGRLLIQAKNLVEVVGQNAFLTADVNSGATGQGGSLKIETKRLSVRDGGQVGSSTFGTGNAGDVFVHATDVDILGAAANGSLSGVFSTSSQKARGNGGNLFIETRNLNLSDQGRLSSQSRGAGTAGNITVNARNIRMRSNSNILTISNNGDGGNITLNAKTIVALGNSDILAFAPAGRGGNITFNTRAFLSDPLYRSLPPITDRAALFALLTNNQVDVNASGTVSGTVSGVPDITFLQNGLAQLSQSLIDPNTLLANGCIVRNRQQNGSFLITGSGGLPVRPGDAPLSSFPTGAVRNVGEEGSGESGVGSGKEWKLGDSIVEPQDIYRLPNGKLILSRECEQ